MKSFETQINGIACRCKVLFYRPHQPARLAGAMEDAEEAIPSEFQFALYVGDTPTPHLEEMATLADIDRLQDEYEAFVLAEKHEKEF